jgi:hypothetical protein
MDDSDAGRERHHAAYHEAGHVIADMVFGYRFRFVTILPAGPDGDDGAVYGFTRGRARDLAVVQLAGIAAAAKMEGSDPWENTARPDDDESDMAAAGRFTDNWVIFLTRTYGEAPYREQIWDEIRKNTLLLVEENWKPVEIIAAALLEKEKLPYDDVIAILKNQCPEFIFGKKSGSP